MHIDLENKTARFKSGVQIKEGDIVSLNGAKGLVYAARIDTMDASENPSFIKFMGIVDKFRTLGVRTNADTPEDAEKTAKLFDLLLGDDLQGRKDMIAEHGHEYLDMLDIS